MRERAAELERALAAEPQEGRRRPQTRVPRVLTYLREIDMVRSYPLDDTEPVDITKTPLAFPRARSVILQALSRGLTQAVIASATHAIRGFGLSHPTVGELRHGTVAVTIDAPGSDAPTEDDAYYLGAIPVTEVESLIVSDEVDDRGRTTAAPSTWATALWWATTRARRSP